jgi:molybdopterin-guanine dinucleotide biosynthesis protein A
LIPLAGRPLLEHVIACLSGQAAPLLVSANGDPEPLRGFGLPLIADTLPNFQGPLAGIIAAMEWLDREGIESASLLSVSVDTPFLPVDLVSRLSEPEHHPAVYAQTGNTPHPTIALWPRSGLSEVRELLLGGERRLRRALSLLRAEAVIWDATEENDPFFNINTLEDLAVAEHRAQWLDQT